MPRNIGSLILKLLVGSFVVGWALTLFDITPLDLLKDLTGTIGQIYSMALSTVRWAADYILLGAVIVIPIWAIIAGLNYLQKKGVRSFAAVPFLAPWPDPAGHPFATSVQHVLDPVQQDGCLQCWPA